MLKYVFVIMLCFYITPLFAKGLLITSGEFPPYASQHLSDKGIASQIVIGAFKLSTTRMNVELQFLPWKRAMASLRNNDAAASYPYFMNAHRQQEFYFSEPLYASTGLVYGNELTKADATPRAESLVCLPLGFAMGAMADIIEKYNLVLVRPNYLVQCFQLLYKQRVDYVFADKDVAEFIVKYKLQPSPEKMYPLPFFNTHSNLHLMVKRSEQGRLILNSFNQGLQAFKQTQQYKNLLQKVH